jgi:hypothetical protein
MVFVGDVRTDLLAAIPGRLADEVDAAAHVQAAGFGRKREYKIALGSWPSTSEFGRPRSAAGVVGELEVPATCSAS